MKPGDTVRWKPEYRPNGEPMVIFEGEPGFVRLDGPQGSLVSPTLLELVEEAPAVQDDGLMAVVEAQMAEIDRLATALDDANTEGEQLARDIETLESRRAGEGEGFREEVERMLGNLCIALGYDRRPLVKTGIHELDVLCRFVGDE